MAGDKMQRLQTTEELMTYIKSAQDTAFVTNGLAKTSLDDEEVRLLYFLNTTQFNCCHIIIQVPLNSPVKDRRMTSFYMTCLCLHS